MCQNSVAGRRDDDVSAAASAGVPLHEDASTTPAKAASGAVEEAGRKLNQTRNHYKKVPCSYLPGACYSIVVKCFSSVSAPDHAEFVATAYGFYHSLVVLTRCAVAAQLLQNVL